ncbi:Hsp70 family protein [Actimicrobium sp. CCI2.3]|uniref:Hsp70 family protein n=1 Tax=Actimicrobium sp. CCI2.3 TaxID=3048616 RepID=UPI002AB458B9|nr:Hsp70 family protein [Actimicrobium sp. CCI2.3]MDY7576596.1 Hsp70 family protein [Actimicrobium sp. CCI2.3]MEB0021197.1 Hsp70 family protein [Actimicrobium sp. CCI2.3]
MANACGVDFGTSNSTVGVVRPGHAALLALEDGKLTLPSAVFFNAEDEQVSYGRAALANYLAGYEGRLMRSLKSLLGTGLIDGQTEVLGRALPFRMLLGQFIGELKRRAETASGQSFQHAVIGRPVFFVDGNEKADRLAEQTLSDIAGAAGFRQVAFQFEPIAAAFDYESRIDREEIVLVADIGGGTSDFSLIRVSPQRARQVDRRSDILASGGVHIGGTDFDKYLSLSSVMPLLGLGSQLNNDSEVPSSYYFNLATWHTINLAYTQKTWLQLKDIYRDARDRPKLDRLLDVIRERSGHWLAIQVEEGKIALSQAESAILNLDRLAPREEVTITRDAFDASIVRLLGTVESTVADLLRDAGVAASDVDTVFFTGGSSGVGSLRQRIARLVPDARAIEGDLFGSIGAGLALDALRRFG